MTYIGQTIKHTHLISRKATMATVIGQEYKNDHTKLTVKTEDGEIKTWDRRATWDMLNGGFAELAIESFEMMDDNNISSVKWVYNNSGHKIYTGRNLLLSTKDVSMAKSTFMQIKKERNIKLAIAQAQSALMGTTQILA